MRAVQVYKALSASPNRTIIMLPTTPEGTGLPQVLTDGKRKVLTKADEQLLEDMETRYMKVAGKPVPETTGSPAPRTPTPPTAAPPTAAPPAAAPPAAAPPAAAPPAAAPIVH
jgi:hypothetical protein